MRLILTIEYDGTPFRGWAAQPGLPTIEAELFLRRPEPEGAFFRVPDGPGLGIAVSDAAIRANARTLASRD